MKRKKSISNMVRERFERENISIRPCEVKYLTSFINAFNMRVPPVNIVTMKAFAIKRCGKKIPYRYEKFCYLYENLRKEMKK